MASIGKVPCMALSVVLLLSFGAFAEDNFETEDIILNPDGTMPEPENPEISFGQTARDCFIDDMISLGEDLYIKAGGKPQQAYLKSDIYVCKNFTTYVFRQCRAGYRMAEYPEVALKIPDNLPEKQCRPYNYGYCWKDISAPDGNPFEIAAQFLYDSNSQRKKTINGHWSL